MEGRRQGYVKVKRRRAEDFDGNFSRILLEYTLPLVSFECHRMLMHRTLMLTCVTRKLLRPWSMA